MTGNWGMAIMLTIGKGALYWVSAKGYRSMANMRKWRGDEKSRTCANDREKLSREMMALYKKKALIH